MENRSYHPITESLKCNRSEILSTNIYPHNFVKHLREN